MFTNSRSSTNPENLTKIGPADVEKIGLTEIVKSQRSREHIAPPVPAADAQQQQAK